jgi:hypothetical protein
VLRTRARDASPLLSACHHRPNPGPRNACSTRRLLPAPDPASHARLALARAYDDLPRKEDVLGQPPVHEVARGGERRSGEANLADAAVVGLRARGRAGGWADGAEGADGGEDCGRLRPWRKRLLASMALSWPSAIRLAVAAVLLVGVGVALFTLPVEKVRAPVLPSRCEFVPCFFP